MTEDSYHRTNIKILKVFPRFILGKCRCGDCDEDIPIRSTDGTLKKIKYKHNPKGKNHYLYKQGIVKHGLYRYIKKT
jgi:hypothetical protein